MHVRWLRKAGANLDAAAAYIARDNPTASDQVVDRITKAVEALRQHPSMGRPGRVIGTRELVVPGTPYVVPYRVRHGVVEILRVYHAARKWPNRF